MFLNENICIFIHIYLNSGRRREINGMSKLGLEMAWPEYEPSHILGNDDPDPDGHMRQHA